jgi:hypothetical protein
VPPASTEDLSGDKLLADLPRDSSGRPTAGGIPLLRCIGRGGMGSVYAAVHPRLQLDVAVKILPFHLVQRDPSIVSRFLFEARIAASLANDHLVRVLDVNHEGSTHFLVMEFVEGESAGAIAKRRGPLPEKDALEIVTAATRGLAAAHERGIVHRDVKPDNILVPRGSLSKAKLADLGLAKPEGARGTTIGTMPDVAMGTPGYMAPEQAEDARAASPASDVFAMGATLHALLAGRPPFHGASLVAVLRDTIEKPHEPLPDGASPGLRALVDRCLAKKPADRFADAKALLAALLKLRAAPPPAPRASRPELAVYALGALALIAVAITAIVVFWPSPPADDSAFREYFRAADAARTIARAKNDAAARTAVAEAADKAAAAATNPSDAARARALAAEARTSAARKAPPPPPARIELAFRPRVGDTLVTRTESVSVVHVGRMTTHRSEIGTATTTFLLVNNGRLTKKRLDFGEVYVDTRGENERPRRQANPLSGRKITATLQGGKVTLEGADDLEERVTRGIRMDEDFTFWLPRNPVAIGDSWDVDINMFRAGLLARFGSNDIPEGRVLLTLREVRDLDGRSCAFIATKVDLKNKSVEMHIAGELVAWIERGYVLRNSAKGTVKVDLPGDAELDGELTITEQTSLP